MTTEYPRQINTRETFDKLVSWIQQTATEQNAPGVIVGLSGTDSILTFLACHQAYQNLGKPERVVGVNFVHDVADPDGTGPIQCIGADKNWFSEEIMPWLQDVAPGSTLITDDTIKVSDDNKRWGRLFSMAVEDVDARQGMNSDHYFVVGTINKTEKTLGTYSLAAARPSMQPISQLYKTEVLQICEMLGVPDIAMQKSREIDCDCGRFDVQANHLDELDLFLMADAGLLDMEYVTANVPPETLTAVREFTVEETMTNAFRDKIPYRPNDRTLIFEGSDIRAAKESAALRSDHVKPISVATPHIITGRFTNDAYDLVMSPSRNRAHWTAEALTLMDAPGLTIDQQRDMAEKLFRTRRVLDDDTVSKLSSISGRLGNAAFSFPTKRWTTMAFGKDGISLIERAGFERHERPNDVRDPDLPKFNPQRDEFGTGFTWENDPYYVEQRRAYTIFSDQTYGQEITVLVRNSSHFFGRDRLADPAYVSFDPVSAEELYNLDRAMLENDERFMPWQDVVRNTRGSALRGKLRKVISALDGMDDIDMKFSQWLKTGDRPIRYRGSHSVISGMFNNEESGGLAHLREFLVGGLARHVQAEKAGSPLYLASIEAGKAPWHPRNVTAVTPDTLAALKSYQDGKPLRDSDLRTLFNPLPRADNQLVLLTGEHGDFPVIGAP